MACFVITGGPCCGKTTLIHGLEKKGYHIVHEAARDIITCYPSLRKENYMEFQRKIFREKIRREEQAPSDRIVFFDRGIPDTITYLRLAGIPADDPDLLDALRRFRYDGIFIPDRLPLVDDGIRYEDKEKAEKVYLGIWEDYINLGYDPILVPRWPGDIETSVRKRVEFVETWVDYMLKI